MNGKLLSDLAGLGAAFTWGLSALAWSFAGRRAGSLAVACIRILLAALIMAVIHLIFFGIPFPWDMEGESFWLLVASGAIAMGFGDICLFRGLVMIGPRLGMLIMSFSPILTTVMAWGMVGEGLGLRAIAGIVLTVAGVAWVVAEPHGQRSWGVQPGHFKQGVALCLAATALIAVGFVLSSIALKGGERHFTAGPPLPPTNRFSATLTRVAASTVVSWSILPLLGRFRRTVKVMADRKAMRYIVPGTIVGPIIGVWLSMTALAGAATGVASALINTSPIMMIPMTYIAYREKPTLRTLAGTIVAVAGIFLLMVRAR
ncbi:MAG TPA: DMT family transporter [Phycisphaerae bacterium]|nr:DMT family transporter [Phycisphaerae bacterium]HUT62038.1 DMT family transporter [Phycisphaerae bacterium]